MFERGDNVAEIAASVTEEKGPTVRAVLDAERGGPVAIPV